MGLKKVDMSPHFIRVVIVISNYNLEWRRSVTILSIMDSNGRLDEYERRRKTYERKLRQTNGAKENILCR